MDIGQLEQLEEASQLTKKVGVAFGDDGQPTEGFIIVSKDSKEFREASARVRARAIQRQTNRKMRIDRTTEEGALKLDSVVQENELELALAVTVGWFGFTQPDGNGGQMPAPFNKDLAEKAFKIKPTWREKITAALEDEDGFLPS